MGTMIAYDRAALPSIGWGATVYEKRKLVEPGGQVAIAQVFVDGRGMYLWQIDLVEGRRGRGTGSRLLALLCGECDRRLLSLRLTATDGTVEGTARLVNWYTRHGFAIVAQVPGEGVRMRRRPR